MKTKLLTILSLLVLCVTGAWAGDYTETFTSLGTRADTPSDYYGSGISKIVLGANASTGSPITASSNGATGKFTISTPTGFTIKTITFNYDGNVTSVTCNDTPSTTINDDTTSKLITYTASSSTTSVEFTFVSKSNKKGKISNLAITTTNNTTDDYERITPSGSITDGAIPFTSTLGEATLVTAFAPYNGTSSASSGNVDFGNGRGISITTSRAIKAIYTVWYQRVPATDGGWTGKDSEGNTIGTYSCTTNAWTASDANTKFVSLVRGEGSAAKLNAIHIFYYDDVAAQNITWANGGHGTAPTEPAIGSIITLPQMEADGGYTHTGWKADQTVKVAGEDVAANTTIAVGTQVTLTAATTFTGVWKGSSSLSVGSTEVEVAIAGTSQIATSNAKGTVSYASADESVATVSNTGLITAVAGGKTTITVTDEGDETTAAGSTTVTVLVPYPNPSAATSYLLNQDTYAFQNIDNTKYYFTNGFTIDVTGGGADFQNGSYAKSKKYSHARSYTINVPNNVTVTYAVITARNNYANENENPAANWGNVFGTNYSSEGNLPWNNQTPAEKDFVIATPSAGGTLTFQPGGNQWQAIINLCTDTYIPKHTANFVAGDGTGTMTGIEAREGSEFTLPIQGTIAAPTGKYFTGWNDGTNDYVPGDSYTMSTADVTFTAQWATSAEANHYHYGYKDATHYNGTAFTDPLGNAAVKTGTSAEDDNRALANGNLCSSLGGITSVAISSVQYDCKDSYMNAYLKIAKGGTAKVTVTIADGYVATLTLKANGYSKNAGISVSDATKISGSEGGVATVEDNYNTLVYTLTSGSHDITCSSNNMYISEMDIVTTQSISGTISASGWNTFSSVYPLDLGTITATNEVAAYYASAASGSSVTMSTTSATVPAGEGLMIKGTVGDTFTINVAQSGTSIDGNLLVGLPNGGTVPVAGEGVNYVFGWTDASNPGFYKIESDTPTLGAGKAYLHTTSALGSKLGLIFDDGETTNIKLNVNDSLDSDAAMYNLAGQKVSNSYKGIVIVNGKKYVCK